MESTTKTSKYNNSNKRMKEYSEEGNSTSSAFLDVAGNDSTMESNVGSSYISNSTRRTSISNLRTDINAKDGCQNSNEDDAYYGTEICMVCITKSVKKRATHFCETCDTRGRYICSNCMNDHNNIWCPDHEVVSLSIDKRTEYAWKNIERSQQVTRGNIHSDYIYSWVQDTPNDEEKNYGKLEELNMASHVGTVGTNDSDYTYAVSDTLQRPRTPDPIHENIRDQHYDANSGNSHPQNKDTVFNFASNSMLQYNNQRKQCHKSCRDYNRVKSDTDISQRPRMPLPMHGNIQDQHYDAHSGKSYSQDENKLRHSVSNSVLKLKQRDKDFDKSRTPDPIYVNLRDRQYDANSGNSNPQNNSADYSFLQRNQQLNEDLYLTPFEIVQNDETQAKTFIQTDCEIESETQSINRFSDARRNQRRSPEIEESTPEYTRERHGPDYFSRLAGIYQSFRGSYYIPRDNGRREEHEYFTADTVLSDRSKVREKMVS